MKAISSSYEILTPINTNRIMRNIECAGRVAYQSGVNASPASASAFVKSLIERGHESVLEHESISVKFVYDRGISHEQVRHRLASYTQESTRYCNYSKGKFQEEIRCIKPFFFDENEQRKDVSDVIGTDTLVHALSWQDTLLCALSSFRASMVNKLDVWFIAMQYAEAFYMGLIAMGATPQEARGVLPNSLATEIVVTANLREWRHILKLRTAPSAHPQMREIMVPLLSELQWELPDIFGDIPYSGKGDEQ